MKRQHQEAPPIPPRIRAPRAQIPESIEALVLRALAKAPGDRFASATAFLVALEAESERLMLRLPPGYHLLSRALAGPERPANHEHAAPVPAEATVPNEPPAVAPTPAPAPAKPGPLRIRAGFTAGLFGGVAVSLAVSGALRSLQEPAAPATGPAARIDGPGRGAEEPAPVVARPRSEQTPTDEREIQAPKPAPPDEPSGDLDSANGERGLGPVRPPGRPPVRAAKVEPEADATRLLEAARRKMRACPGHPASFSTRVEISRGKARVLEIDGYEVDPSDPWQPCVRAVIEAVAFGTLDIVLQTRIGLR